MSVSFHMPKYSTSAFYFAIIDLAVLDGEVAVPCNLQSAIARWNSRERSSPVKLSLVGGDEILVLRNRTLRTVSDLDGSSTKESVLCAVRLPDLSLRPRVGLLAEEFLHDFADAGHAGHAADERRAWRKVWRRPSL